MNKVTRDNIGSHLLDYQLKIIGKTFVDMVDDDRWRFNFTLTTTEYRSFRKYALLLIKKTFRCNSSKAKDTFDWFYMNFGLRIKNQKPNG